jgi:hypothetical protein
VSSENVYWQFIGLIFQKFKHGFIMVTRRQNDMFGASVPITPQTDLPGTEAYLKVPSMRDGLSYITSETADWERLED